MKKYGLIIIALLFISVTGFIPQTAADGENWLWGWDYRRAVNLNGSAGAGTNYQIKLTVEETSEIEFNFADIRFTDNDGYTLLDYWMERYDEVDPGGAGDDNIGYFWVNVTDNLDTDQTIYMYYGNDAVSTTSDGHTTFQEFYDNDSTAGWSTSGGLTVTTSGDFLRFYNPVPTSVGYAQRTDITTSADFQYMAQYKTVSLGATDAGATIIMDGSTTHRFSQSVTPYANIQTEWYYYDGATQAGGAWVEGTEFIFTTQIDEGDAVNGVDFRRYDTSWSLLDSVLGENFALGTPTDCDAINIGDQSGAGTIDAYFRWIAFRKCIDSPPVFSAWGEEETEPTRAWNTIGDVDLIFPIGWDPTFQFGYDAVFIFAGLIMIPLSTIYMVRGGRKGASMDKVFYALIIFIVGLGLLVGGIMP